MGRVVITEFMDDRAGAQLRARHDVHYDAKLVDDGATLHALAAGADALIVRNRTQVRGELLATLQRCKVVGRLGVGLDNIDVTACEARGMRVIPATGANALSVAEYVIASAMLLLRGAPTNRPPTSPPASGRAMRSRMDARLPARRWAWSGSDRSASSRRSWGRRSE